MLINVENLWIVLKKCGKLSVKKLHNSVILIQKRVKTAIFSIKQHQKGERKNVVAVFDDNFNTTEKCITLLVWRSECIVL